MINVPTSHTKPELALAMILRKLGYNMFLTPPMSALKFGCRPHPIFPDILFVRERIVMEVMGEYWHLPSRYKTRKRRMDKDEARKQCIINNNYKYIEFSDIEVLWAAKYLTGKTNDMVRARSAYNLVVKKIRGVFR